MMATNNNFDWGGLVDSALGAGGALWSAGQNRDAIARALEAQQAGGGAAIGDYSPYADVGKNAISMLNNEDITQLPGYQTGLAEGINAINRRALATGGFNSGNRLKALMKYGVDYNTAKTADRQNQLMQMIQMGQGAAGNQAGVRTGMGNATGAAAIAGNNSAQTGIGAALDLASKYLTSKADNGKSNAQNMWGAATDYFSSPNASNNADMWNSTYGNQSFDLPSDWL